MAKQSTFWTKWIIFSLSVIIVVGCSNRKPEGDLPPEVPATEAVITEQIRKLEELKGGGYKGRISPGMPGAPGAPGGS